jgi:hypothetical protein
VVRWHSGLYPRRRAQAIGGDEATDGGVGMTTVAIDLSPQEGDQVFSYYRGETMLHFNTSLLARIRKEAPQVFRRVTIELDDAIYNLCMDHRGIEEPKVERLRPADLREPGYAAIFPESDYTIVDGHHRLVRRYRGGVRTMDFYFSIKQIWQHCLVHYGEEALAQIADSLPERVQDDRQHIASFARLHPSEEKDK